MLTYFMNANVLYILAVFEKVEINTSVYPCMEISEALSLKKKNLQLKGMYKNKERL